MSHPKKILIAIAVVLGLGGGGYAAWHTAKVLSIASAYFAKTLCSGMYVTGRHKRYVAEEDVMADMTVGLQYWHKEIYPERKLVDMTILGMARREAVYRPGLGCTLLTDTTQEELEAQARDYSPPPPSGRSSALWPEGNAVDLDEVPAEVEFS